MSFSGNLSDARAAIASVELSENTRTSSGTSPIKSGASGPGGAASKAPTAGQTMVPKRTSVKTCTDSLKRSSY